MEPFAMRKGQRERLRDQREQFENALRPIFSSPDGKLMFFNAEQNEKASSPTETRLSGSVSDISDEHRKNAPSPRATIPFGRDT